MNLTSRTGGQRRLSGNHSRVLSSTSSRWSQISAIELRRGCGWESAFVWPRGSSAPPPSAIFGQADLQQGHLVAERIAMDAERASGADQIARGELHGARNVFLLE